MRLFFYLRRSLVGLRAGVGGPLLYWLTQLNSWYVALQKLAQQIMLITRDNEDRSNNLAFKRDRVNNRPFVLIARQYKAREVIEILSDSAQRGSSSHLASLQARSGKRNGPFVLALAGGNA
jgi:hypothetical protein